MLLPGGERPAPTEAGAETGAWTVATGDQAPSGYEGWLVMTYSPVKPYVGGAGWRLRRGLPPIGVAVSLAGGRFWVRVWVREWSTPAAQKLRR